MVVFVHTMYIDFLVIIPYKNIIPCNKSITTLHIALGIVRHLGRIQSMQEDCIRCVQIHHFILVTRTSTDFGILGVLEQTLKILREDCIMILFLLMHYNIEGVL